VFVSRFQKNLVILYQSGETQIWFFINVLGAFHLGLIPIITTVLRVPNVSCDFIKVTKETNFNFWDSAAFKEITWNVLNWQNWGFTKFLSKTKSLIAFSASSKTFVLAQKLNLLYESHLLV
jgi:hypothetical protein